MINIKTDDLQVKFTSCCLVNYFKSKIPDCSILKIEMKDVLSHTLFIQVLPGGTGNYYI